MDTTVPVNSVMIVVSNATGTAGYFAQMNGKYFAAKVAVMADTHTITAIATDQTGTRHQMSVSVHPVIQSTTVDILASPSVGIPTLKQSGKTTLDVSLMSTPSITSPIASYSWDFDGSGSDDLTCYSHSGVEASYEQTGLFLTKVAVTDAQGNTYTDTAIVNVMDSGDVEGKFRAIWNRVKTALENKDISGAIADIAEHTRSGYQYTFEQYIDWLPAISQSMNVNNINVVGYNENIAEFELLKIKNGVELSQYIEFVRDPDGVWRLSFF